MQKKMLEIFLTITLVGIVCAACQPQETKEETAGAVLKGIVPGQKTTEEKEPIKEQDTVEEAPVIKTPVEQVPNDQVIPSDAIQTETPAAEKKQTLVNSGQEATEHLKKNIEEGTNEDVTFGSDGVLETDELGSFYYVRLVSISLRLAGGTGSLDTYKVYQDGTFRTMHG